MEDSQPLYDEFGTYIGPALDDDDDVHDQGPPQPAHDDLSDQRSPVAQTPDANGQGTKETETNRKAVILYEDRKIYPDASELYPEAETLVMDEDIQPLSEPIIAPLKTKNFHLLEKKKEFPAVTYTKEFLIQMTECRELIRNVAVVGHLHHGKTSLLDMLINQTHEKDWAAAKQNRYTDSLVIEQERGVSIKTHPMSLVLESSSGKSFLFNLLDTPGHVNFSDESSAALRLADGALVLVDAVEGVMMQTERMLKQAVAEGLPVVVCLNKLDRLILELKLPPAEAYFKLRHTLEEVNAILGAASAGRVQVSPEAGTVCFASTMMSWCFTLQSFAKLYAQHYGVALIPDVFAQQLWGDVWYHAQDRTFRRKAPTNTRTERSFVQFVLNPLYKLHAQAVGEDQAVLRQTLEGLGIYLRKDQFNLDSRLLLKLVMSHFFGPATGLIDMLVKHIPSPVSGAPAKVERVYTGPMDSPEAQAMRACDAAGPLMVYVTKLLPKPDCTSFEALGRVFSGTLRSGDSVRVLGEGYTPEEPEDMQLRDVARLALPEGRYRVDMAAAGPGCLVLLDGVDANIVKTATLVAGADPPSDVRIFAPLKHSTLSTVKVAVEPINPSELPKMLEGLRKVNKTYPLLTTKVEESGEHVILGTGELFLDCVLHDLRRMYAEIEIKVSDPVVSFCETVLETSAVKCFAVTPNKENKLTMTAEPLEKGLAEDIEHGLLAGLLSDNKSREKQSQNLLRQKYEWDILAARSVWAFGPDPLTGPNLLVNDTLQDTDKALLATCRDSIVQGFQWGTREGPLCEEPIRNVKFKILHADMSSKPIQRGGGQIIPTARRVAYSAFLTATPRLMEPVYAVEIQAPADSVAAIFNVLSRRRGHMTEDAPKPGSPLYTVKAFLPVVESFGFETDLRSHTQGQAFCLSVFDHWAVVPGDPLDKSIQLKPLEIAPASALAREFMVKTRRRKGLSDDVSPTKFFDEDLLQQLQVLNEGGANPLL